MNTGNQPELFFYYNNKNHSNITFVREFLYT